MLSASNGCNSLGFTDNSAVKDVGQETGTVIIAFYDVAVESYADFKLAMLDQKQGESVVFYYIENTVAGRKDRKIIKLELR